MTDQPQLEGMPEPLEAVKVSVSTFSVLLAEWLDLGTDVRVTIEGRVARVGDESTEAGAKHFYGVKVDVAKMEAI